MLKFTHFLSSKRFVKLEKNFYKRNFHFALIVTFYIFKRKPFPVLIYVCVRVCK